MEYKKLGQTDLNISRIGFGCWAIGGHGYGRVDDKQSIRAIETALDLGINFFDTADVYGFGHSENILSQALGSKRSDVVIATKFGVGWDEHGKTYKDTGAKRVKAALENSLKRLKVDCIPLYQIHWYDGKTPLQETMAALDQCRREGKIQYAGCTNFALNQIREAHRFGRIESLQTIYNPINRSQVLEIKGAQDEFQMGVIIYEILGRGLLTGKYNSNLAFGQNDTRKTDRLFQEQNLKWMPPVLERLQEIGAGYNRSIPQVAIRFVLDTPGVQCALLGQKTEHQVRENLQALEWVLSKKDWSEIDEMTLHR